MGSTRRLEPTPEQRTIIEEKIVESIDGDPNILARRICTEVHALPLLFDFTAVMAIRPDGELVWIDEDLSRVRLVEDERERTIGLFQGSLRDPDLGFLVPPRPADAVDCPDCRGTGRIPFPEGSEHLADLVICYCGGIGWLPASSGTSGRAPLDRKLRQDGFEDGLPAILPDERVAEVVSRLMGVPVDQLKGGVYPNRPLFDLADSLDMIELIMELEEEFDKETVKLALRYAQALASQDTLARRPRHPSPSSSEGPDPLWDRELDG
jgi:acyl carrier protein